MGVRSKSTGFAPAESSIPQSESIPLAEVCCQMPAGVTKADLVSHLCRWCHNRPETTVALAMAAEVARDWMALTLEAPARLSWTQWVEVARAAGIGAAQDLEDWQQCLQRLFLAVKRKKPSALLQQRRQQAFARVVKSLGVARVAKLTGASCKEVQDIANFLKPLGAARLRTMERRLSLLTGWLNRDEVLPPGLVTRPALRLVQTGP